MDQTVKPIGDSIVLRELTPSMVGEMWLRGQRQQEIADAKVREEIAKKRNQIPEDPMLVHIYIEFPRTESGQNSLVAAYEAIFMDRAPSNLPRHEWFEQLSDCFPAGERHPNSLNLTAQHDRGHDLGPLLQGLRTAIPEAVEIHVYAAQEPIPEGCRIPRDRKLVAFPAQVTAA